jgi:hypothetical protein
VVIEEMARARVYINEALSQRAAAKIKVRQPLALVRMPKLSDEFAGIVADEVNVKSVTWHEAGVELDTSITPELASEGMARDIVRLVQNARKEALLAPDDRIRLHIAGETQGQLNQAMTSHRDFIMSETLATTLDDKVDGEVIPVQVGQEEVRITLQKA